MSLTGFSLFSAHCAADHTPDAAAKSSEHLKETLRNIMQISGRIHGAAMSLQTKHIYEFGPFRLVVAEHLLLLDGETVQLTPKAFDLLLALVERHGHLLEKDELLKKVWPDTFVEEANLASNISQLRKALGDGDNGQRFIETAPKRGYRFVASVNKVEDERAEPTIQEHRGYQSAAAEGDQKFKRYKRSALFVLAMLILSVVGLTYFVLRLPLAPKVTTYNQITKDGLQKGSNGFASLVTDGSRIYFSQSVDGQPVTAQVSVTGGEVVSIPAPLPAVYVMDISPSRSELLVQSGFGGLFE